MEKQLKTIHVIALWYHIYKFFTSLTLKKKSYFTFASILTYKSYLLSFLQAHFFMVDYTSCSFSMIYVPHLLIDQSP